VWRWWSRFRAAWKYASGTEAETTLATLFAAKEALAQFLAEAQTKREVIAREWSKAVRRHQNLEAGTKLRCDRMLEKLDKLLRVGPRHRNLRSKNKQDEHAQHE